MNTMKKLTKAQETALRTIAENPGKVASNWNLTSDDLLYIRVTTGSALAEAGLITAVQTDLIKTYTYRTGYTVSVDIITWELADKGREYLGM
jgi:hypothetical protein